VAGKWLAETRLLSHIQHKSRSRGSTCAHDREKEVTTGQARPDKSQGGNI